MAPEPQWILGKATRWNSDQSCSVRLLADKPDVWSTLSDAVVVRWQFPNKGTPEDALSDVERFEELLRPLWSGASSCLAFVLTYADRREWTFYAADVSAFVRDLNEVLAGQQRYPITLEHEKDPSWSLWAQFDALRKS